jgi:ferredoxin, 2Fe-2S
MPSIKIISRNGSETRIMAQEGMSVMEVIRDGGYDELLALCGGCCSCATCHVHIDDATLGKLAAMTADESDLLDSSSHRNASSRLSCQLPVTSSLESAVITIAAED